MKNERINVFENGRVFLTFFTFFNPLFNSLIL